jgi:hypothetical protein
VTSTKTYMLVPHYDFPADGSLQLGDIALTQWSPSESLNEGDVVEIPATSRHSSHKYNREQTIDYTTVEMEEPVEPVYERVVSISMDLVEILPEALTQRSSITTDSKILKRHISSPLRNTSTKQLANPLFSHFLKAVASLQ